MLFCRSGDICLKKIAVQSYAQQQYKINPIAVKASKKKNSSKKEEAGLIGKGIDLLLDFFFGDIATMVAPDSTFGERVIATGFTFFKPAKLGGMFLDSLKIADSAKDIRKATKGTGYAVLNNGRVTVDAIKSNPSAFKGKSADEIAQMLKNEGYDVTLKDSTKSSSGAKIIKINNTGGDRNITQVQVSPGGGRHGGSPYVKISTNDQGIIKVIDGTESTYKTDGKETATIIFTGGN